MNVAVLVLGCLLTQAEADLRTPVDLKQIQYTITLDLAEYRPCQPIVVRSTIKNIGTTPIVVPEPSEIAMYVGHEVFHPTDAGLETVNEAPEPARNRLWAARDVRLDPGQSTSLSSELYVGGGAGFDSGFEPGEYVFRARYYPDLTNWTYDTPHVQSNEVSFRVRRQTPEEEEELEVFQRARGDVNMRGKYDGASMREFLKRYPNTIYRSLALSVLSNARFQVKDWRWQLEFFRDKREALNSDTYSDLSYSAEACALVELGDVRAAVKLLRETKLTNSSLMREGLESKYGPFPDDKPPPAPPRPAPAPAPPAQQGSSWLVFGILFGIIVLILLRRFKPTRTK